MLPWLILFVRPPRGGAEEEQLGFLLSCMDGLILTISRPFGALVVRSYKVRLDKLLLFLSRDLLHRSRIILESSISLISHLIALPLLL
ncbi:hypothetical protein Tco_1368300 [Tanacetum coccineum]